ncbi:hypothetical protein JCM19055_4524 [Geomicrobium sp. JCM 19055]|nr:hypothetical protein JCM19055_4524 [Geomicrobium sp. JCM 19055]
MIYFLLRIIKPNVLFLWFLLIVLACLVNVLPFLTLLKQKKNPFTNFHTIIRDCERLSHFL